MREREAEVEKNVEKEKKTDSNSLHLSVVLLEVCERLPELRSRSDVRDGSSGAGLLCVVLVGERERNEREGSDALLEKKAWSFQIAGTRKTKVDSRSLPGTSPPHSGGSPRSRRRSRRRRPSWREKRKKREKEDEKRDRESKDERRRFSSFAAVERANEKKKK